MSHYLFLLLLGYSQYIFYVQMGDKGKNNMKCLIKVSFYYEPLEQLQCSCWRDEHNFYYIIVL